MLSTLDAAQCNKSPTENCCSVLFMMCWHKFKMIFNDHFIASRQTSAVWRIQCRYGVTHLSRTNKATSASDRRPSAPWVLSSAGKLIRYLHGSYFLPYRSADVFRFSFLSAISIFLSLGSAVHWTLSPPHHEPYMLIGYKFVLVLGPDSGMTYPTFNCSMLRRGCVAVYAGSENSQIASKIS